jgi:hypothetical protein
VSIEDFSQQQNAIASDNNRRTEGEYSEAAPKESDAGKPQHETSDLQLTCGLEYRSGRQESIKKRAFHNGARRAGFGAPTRRHDASTQWMRFDYIDQIIISQRP